MTRISQSQCFFPTVLHQNGGHEHEAEMLKLMEF